MTDDEWKSWIQRHEVKEVDSKMKIIWDKAIICSEAYFSERNEVFSSYKYVIVYRGMHSERNYHFVVALSFDLGSHGCAIEGELNEQGDLIRIRNCNEPW